MSYSILEAFKELNGVKINEDFEEFINTTQYSNKPNADTKYVVRWVTKEGFDEEYPEHYFFGKDLEQLKKDFKEFIEKHPLRKELEFAEIHGYNSQEPEEPYDGKLIITLFDNNKWLGESFKNWNSDEEYELDEKEVQNFLKNHRDSDIYAEDAW